MTDSVASFQQSRGQWAGFFVTLVVGLVLYYFIQVSSLIGQNPNGTFKSHQNDFKHLYLGTVMMAEGQSPYDQEVLRDLGDVMRMEDHRFDSNVLPYVYLPFTGLVLYPLQWMDFNQAAVAFQLLNHLTLLLGIFLFAYAEKLKPDWKTALLLLLPIILSFSVYRSNNAGQLNCILFCGACLLYLLLKRGAKPWMLGAVAGFLMLFKITPGIFLIWFLLTKRFREAAWMMGLALGATLICALIVGFDTHLEFLPLLSDMGYGKSTWAELGQTYWRDPMNQSFNSFFHHILVPWEGFSPWINSSPAVANGLTWVVSLAMLGAFGVLCFLSTRVKSDETFSKSHGLTFGAAILISMLTPSIMWDHYLVQGLLPAWIIWFGSENCRKPWKIAIRFVVILFWIFSNLVLRAGSQPISLGVLGQFSLGLELFPVPTSSGNLRMVWMSMKLWPTFLLLICALGLIWSSLQENGKRDSRL